ncbi:MAG: 2-octaprenyl-3-methyl-6-methoxy,4-benzoquinol hydroxylase [Verrucomicrobiaceae bacterium]|nr:2-octaprenyl-3-methyl-6-methoxy,4-benzoquinol hydroxylase [Verrucomicrobiaceae bacterium]
MSSRHLSAFDRALIQFDQALHTLVPGTARAQRANPAKSELEADLDAKERHHTAGLMRINHTGEICAQALYQGQALTAKLGKVRAAMSQAAQEEVDHLAWCEQQLKALDSRPSVLNPLFYGASLALGAAAGLLGDKISLGFVAATEEQVCRHLREHLDQLPIQDQANRAVLTQMLDDEEKHGTVALEAGGTRFPRWIKRAMKQASKAMTATTYRI